MALSREQETLARKLEYQVGDENTSSHRYNELARDARAIGEKGLAESLEEIALQESFHAEALHLWAKVVRGRHREIPLPQSPHVPAGHFVVVDRDVHLKWQGWTWSPKTPNIYGPLESQLGRPGYMTKEQAKKAVLAQLRWSMPQLEASIRSAKEAGWTPR